MAQYFADVVLEIVFGSRVIGIIEVLVVEGCLDALDDGFVAVAVIDHDVALRGVEEISHVVLCSAGYGYNGVGVEACC